MEISLPIYLICLGVLVIFTARVSLRAFNNWQEPGARCLGFLMLSMTVWSGFYMVEILHPDLSGKIAARQALYLGMTLSPPLWLGLALQYTGISKWWKEHNRIYLLSIPGFIVFLLGITNEQHRLVWTSMSMPAGLTSPLVLEGGTAFWGHTVLAYIMIGAGVLIYLIEFFRSQKALRIKSGIMLIGASITTVVNLLFLLSNSSPAIDPTPFSFALSAPLLSFGFYRFGMKSLLPLAARIVVDQFRDVMIIVNDRNEVTDMNLAARELLTLQSVPEGISIFRLFQQASLLKGVWDDPETSMKIGYKREGRTCWYEARVIPLSKNNRELLGRVIVLHDVTSEQSLLKAERRRSQQLALLEEIGRNIADSFDEEEILQRAIDAIVHQFGYAIAAISVLKDEGMLEVAAISGTQDYGYKPGFRQRIGEGIIGYTAAAQTTYVSGNVSTDPYYFSTQKNSGSAICTPIFNQEKLYGVLYVESLEPNAFDQVDIKTLETLASQVSASLQRAALHTETQENLRILATLQNISKTISSSLDTEIIAEKVVHGLREAFGYTHVSIYLLEDDYLILTSEVGYPAELKIDRIHISQGVSGRAIRTKTAQFIEDTAGEDVFLKADYDIISEICVPLLKEDTVLGILNVEANNIRKLTRMDVDLLTAIAGPIAVAVDNARLHAQIKKLATTDAVTGLSNRHVFEQALSMEIERAQRMGSSVSLVIFDIDSFKEYNDRFGHPAGDMRLKAMGDIIKNCLRKYDLAARYGGDEFAIILSNATVNDALMFAKRLLQAAQAGASEIVLEGSGVPGYTLSMGVAAFPQDAQTQAELLIAADNAALRAKQLGKNRIQLARDMN
ncbi:MAG: hypothetical protein DPW18_11300 [Chloroflexi bacterium]|nr:hypothetical protein [Chloroflexota bacterium]MDL1944267.1 diguanylate cyclase [Chloroflexi bacterium CFX2]